jgi:hypothetical protein
MAGVAREWVPWVCRGCGGRVKLSRLKCVCDKRTLFAVNGMAERYLQWNKSWVLACGLAFRSSLAPCCSSTALLCSLLPRLHRMSVDGQVVA